MKSIITDNCTGSRHLWQFKALDQEVKFFLYDQIKTWIICLRHLHTLWSMFISKITFWALCDNKSCIINRNSYIVNNKCCIVQWVIFVVVSSRHICISRIISVAISYTCVWILACIFLKPFMLDSLMTFKISFGAKFFSTCITLDVFEQSGETLLKYTDEFTESMHSQLRQFEESHHYKNLKFECESHAEAQHKSIVHINSLNID